MLSELIEAGERFVAEGELPPRSTKARHPAWVIEVGDAGEGTLLGPYKREDHRALRAPDRQRSGSIGPRNLKPYLLLDDARYALGIPDPGEEAAALLAHRGFVAVLEEARRATGDDDLGRILAFLGRPLPEAMRARIGPRELIAFRTPGGEFPCERPAVQEFWSAHLAGELASAEPATCAVCGRRGPIVRTLPTEVVILGQKCQVSSFNSSAFTSRGKSQTANAPLCHRCAADAIAALDYLIRTPRHRATVARDTGRGQGNPLRNQLAVFWLKEARGEPGGAAIDWEAALAALLRPESDPEGGPPPELAQLEALLKLPWTGREGALAIGANSFHLAVLSANKGRLVVRDWLAVPLDRLRDRLAAFVAALRIIGPTGEPARLLPIPALLEALETTDPAASRGLLRAAYLGEPPPAGLRQAAAGRFRDVLLSGKGHNRTAARGEAARRAEQSAVLHALAAAMKLAMTFGKGDGRMEQLDPGRGARAYQSGRLLAVLEEAQRRASRGRLNATLVDRFYGAASLTPASTLGALLRQAEAAHLPKIRRERRGYDQLRRLLEEIMGRFAPGEGLPTTLTLNDQAEFALGFYHQRAAFRAPQKGGQA